MTLTGTWHNSAPPTGDAITEVTISQDSRGLLVAVRGWGEVSAAGYSQDQTSTEPWAVSASFEFDGLHVVLSAYHKTGILVLTTYTVFADAARPGVWTREFFHRGER